MRNNNSLESIRNTKKITQRFQQIHYLCTELVPVDDSITRKQISAKVMNWFRVMIQETQRFQQIHYLCTELVPGD